MLSSPSCDANDCILDDLRVVDSAAAAIGGGGDGLCDGDCWRRRVNSAPKISDNEYDSVVKYSRPDVFISFLDAFSTG